MEMPRQDSAKILYFVGWKDLSCNSCHGRAMFLFFFSFFHNGCYHLSMQMQAINEEVASSDHIYILS